MKKLLIGIAVCIIYAIPTNAQTHRVTIGATGGVNINHIWDAGYPNSPHPKDGIGFMTGISIQYNFPKRLSLHTGLAFERKGWDQEFVFTDNLGNETSRYMLYSIFDYLTIPLLVRWQVSEKIPIFINVGPYTGYLLHQKIQTTSEYSHIFDGTNTYLFKRWDFGVAFGIGANIPVLPFMDVTVEVRENLGLVNIQKNPPPQAIPFYTSALNITAGLQFKLCAR